ncbi:MAG: hypothetical protein HY536_00555 [Candidatus Colwellbacteria bacterium]|nr:hypothetical protein [Candidatus Colwellbacteria bacterium]
MPIERYFVVVSLLLRAGIAILFSYAAVSSFFQPDLWIGYLPLALRDLIPTPPLMILFSVFELGLALWVLSGLRLFYAALTVAFVLVTIIVTNLSELPIIFRDVAVLCAALALMVMYWPRKEE